MSDLEEGMITRYKIRIIKRGFDQTSDDYHATVTRLSDGRELVFINRFKWFLKLRLRRWYLDREFRYYDKRDKKLEQEEVIRR